MKEDLILAVISQIIPKEEPLSEHIIYLQDEHVPTIKRALMYCVLHSEKVNLLSTEIESIEIHPYVSAAVIQNPQCTAVLELVVYKQALHAKAQEYLFSYFISSMSESNRLTEHDDILVYFTYFIDFIKAIMFNTGFEDREDLLEGLLNVFSEEEQIEFEIMIEAINDMKNINHI